MRPGRSCETGTGSVDDFAPEGSLVFTRYAYPPNELGYCGPDAARTLLERGAAGVADVGVASMAREFTGAWPYLELIAEATGIGDPLDRRVVEAYWIGSPLLEQVDAGRFATTVDRLRPPGKDWNLLRGAIPEGAVPHHNFHVFAVYPWAGMLTTTRSPQPLHVLEKCRIRWGQVERVEGDHVVVHSQPLNWNGRTLSLGATRSERVRQADGGLGFVNGLQPGEWVSLHWDWVCDRLTRRQLATLRYYSQQQLLVTNHRVGHPVPAAVAP